MDNQTIHSHLHSLITSFNETDLLDKPTFNQLIEETSPEVVLNILTAFRSTLKDAEGSLNIELANSQKEDVYKICHKLKGSSLMLGFLTFGQQCVEVMRSIKSNSSQEISPDPVNTDALTSIKEQAQLISNNIESILQ